MDGKFHYPLRRKTMFGGIGIPELLVILVIVLIIFGANKLPQIGEGLGKGIQNFKKNIQKKEEIDTTPKNTEEITGEKK
jgi:sec-independent protein translocase protein TatA